MSLSPPCVPLDVCVIRRCDWTDLENQSLERAPRWAHGFLDGSCAWGPRSSKGPSLPPIHLFSSATMYSLSQKSTRPIPGPKNPFPTSIASSQLARARNHVPVSQPLIQRKRVVLSRTTVPPLPVRLFPLFSFCLFFVPLPRYIHTDPRITQCQACAAD